MEGAFTASGNQLLARNKSDGEAKLTANATGLEPSLLANRNEVLTRDKSDGEALVQRRRAAPARFPVAKIIIAPQELIPARAASAGASAYAKSNPEVARTSVSAEGGNDALSHFTGNLTDTELQLLLSAKREEAANLQVAQIKAQLPEGSRDLRKHVVCVDNVPLLVQMFNQSTPLTIAASIRMAQEFGETSAAVCSSLLRPTAGLIRVADAGIIMSQDLFRVPRSLARRGSRDRAVHSQAHRAYGNRAQVQHTAVDTGGNGGVNTNRNDGSDSNDEGRGEADSEDEDEDDEAGGALFRFAAEMASIHASLVLQADSGLHIVSKAIEASRRGLANGEQALVYVLRFEALVSVFISSCTIVGLPLPVTPLGVIWLSFVLAPVLAALMLAAPPSTHTVGARTVPPKRLAEGDEADHEQDLNDAEDEEAAACNCCSLACARCWILTAPCNPPCLKAMRRTTWKCRESDVDGVGPVGRLARRLEGWDTEAAIERERKNTAAMEADLREQSSARASSESHDSRVSSSDSAMEGPEGVEDDGEFQTLQDTIRPALAARLVSAWSSIAVTKAKRAMEHYSAMHSAWVDVAPTPPRSSTEGLQGNKDTAGPSEEWTRARAEAILLATEPKRLLDEEVGVDPESLVLAQPLQGRSLFLADHSAQIELLYRSTGFRCSDGWCVCSTHRPGQAGWTDQGDGDDNDDGIQQAVNESAEDGGREPLDHGRCRGRGSGRKSHAAADAELDSVNASPFDPSIPSVPLHARRLYRPILDKAPESTWASIAPSFAVVVPIACALTIWFGCAVVAASERLARSGAYGGVGLGLPLPAPGNTRSSGAGVFLDGVAGSGAIRFASSFPPVRPIRTGGAGDSSVWFGTYTTDLEGAEPGFDAGTLAVAEGHALGSARGGVMLLLGLAGILLAASMQFKGGSGICDYNSLACSNPAMRASIVWVALAHAVVSLCLSLGVAGEAWEGWGRLWADGTEDRATYAWTAGSSGESQ